MSTAKDRARQWVRDGVRRGTIVKPAKCPTCGSNKSISHHHPRGYDRWRDIEWKCRACHEKADTADIRRAMYGY